MVADGGCQSDMRLTLSPAGGSSLAVCPWHPGVLVCREGHAFQSPAVDDSGSAENLGASADGLCLPAGGNALLVSLVCRSVLHHFHFKGSVHSVSFSPDGR